MENEVNNNTTVANEVNNNATLDIKTNNLDNAPKKKSGIVKIIIIIVLALILVGGGVFAAIKLTSKKDNKKETKEIDRVAVYNNAVSSTFGKINGLVDDFDAVQSKFQIGDKPLYFKGDIKVDSSLFKSEEIGIDITKYKLDLGLGLDSKQQKILLNAGLNDALNAKLYYSNNKVYLISDVLDNPVDITSEITSEMGISSFEDLSVSFSEVNDIEKYNLDDQIKEISKTFEQIIIESIDEDKIETEESSYEVNGEKVDATKLTLTIDEEKLKETIKKLIDKLENDEELISTLASITEVSETEIKEMFEDIDTDDISFEEKIYISVYVPKNSEEATGLSIKVDDEEFLSFYTYNGSLNLTIYDGEDEMTLKTEKKDNGTSFSLKLEEEELFSGVVRELSDKKIDFDITLNDDEDKMTLSIYTTTDEKESSVSGEYNYKLTINEDYISASGKYSLESKDSLENVDVSNAVLAENVDSEKVLTNIQNKIASNNDLKLLFELISAA